MRVVHTHMLLELLKSVMGALSQRVQAVGVHVAGLDMAAREQGIGRDRVVRREPMKGV